MDICNRTVGRINTCLQRIPLLSSPSYLLCTLSGVTDFSKNNCTPLFLPHCELHWKGLPRGTNTPFHGEESLPWALARRYAPSPGPHRHAYMAARTEK